MLVRWLATLTIVVLAPGCTLLELAKLRETEAARARYGRVSGTVTADFAEPPWVVVFMAALPCDADRAALLEAMGETGLDPDRATWSPETKELVERLLAQLRLAEHVVLPTPSDWYADLAPGCYAIGAFADLDRDYRYDDEPITDMARNPRAFVRLAEGEVVEDVALEIEAELRFREAFDPLAEQMRAGGLRTQSDQLAVSLGAVAVAGEVTPLADPRFSREAGRLGYFQIRRSLYEHGAGVHFLEPYDPDRIPVLFVHGALGYPQEFAALIEGLDRERFQAWAFSYPSGASLGPTAGLLSGTIAKLQLRFDFDEMAIVAHSMGGLVSRASILEMGDRLAESPVRLFVSIATPWRGVPSAESGVSRSPFVVPSWRDLAPDSAFLEGLFFVDGEGRSPRPLPEQVAYHLIFGVGDATVPVESTIRWEAQRQAQERWPLPEDHTSILGAPETGILLGEMLEAAFPRRWWDPTD